jgi:hypothetical protein
MTVLKQINQVVAFLLELVMLYMLAVGGYQFGKGSWRYVLAIGLPVLAIGLWGYWSAPRSDHRLAFPYLSMFHILIFGSTTLLWYLTGHQRSAILFLVLVILSEVIAVTLKQ